MEFNEIFIAKDESKHKRVEYTGTKDERCDRCSLEALSWDCKKQHGTCNKNLSNGEHDYYFVLTKKKEEKLPDDETSETIRDIAHCLHGEKDEKFQQGKIYYKADNSNEYMPIMPYLDKPVGKCSRAGTLEVDFDMETKNAENHQDIIRRQEKLIEQLKCLLKERRMEKICCRCKAIDIQLGGDSCNVSGNPVGCCDTCQVMK